MIFKRARIIQKLGKVDNTGLTISKIFINSTFNSTMVVNLLQNSDYAFCLNVLFSREKEKKNEIRLHKLNASLEIS